MYPSGHPSLEPAVVGVVHRADRLLESRQAIGIGVARRQLIVDGIATDPNQAVLRRLAEGLHGHHLGAISIRRGVQPAELAEALRALAEEGDQEGALGLRRGARAPNWAHIGLHPLSFEGLAIVSGAPVSEPGRARAGADGGHLWASLARAAMPADAGVERPSDPAALAKVIDAHPDASAYDQMVAGHLAQIARELRRSSGADADALRQHVSDLIASLRPETLRRLVEMGGDAARRGAFVLDAVHGMAVDAVVDIVRAAAEAGGQTISHGLVRMLAKLATHAEAGSVPSRAMADHALREQARALLRDWHLEDPNPEQYSGVLQHLATSVRTPSGRRPADGRLGNGEPEPMRVVQMSLETGAEGPLLDRALDRIVEQGAISDVLGLLTSPPKEGPAVADTILARLLDPAVLRRLLEREPLDVDSLDRLLPFMYASEYEVLLDALVASQSRVTRRKLMDRLARAHVDISQAIVDRLEAGVWYVQRNMLILLERTGRLPAGFSPELWTGHPDPRVRHEAIRLQLAIPEERDMAARLALDERDPKIVLNALAAIQHHCPPNLAERVARVVLEPAYDDEVRRLAVTTLGPLHQLQALEALLQVVDGGKTLLGRAKLAPRTPVVLAAVRALAAGWAADRRAKAVLALASESSDPEVRLAARPCRS